MLCTGLTFRAMNGMAHGIAAQGKAALQPASPAGCEIAHRTHRQLRKSIQLFNTIAFVLFISIDASYSEWFSISMTDFPHFLPFFALRLHFFRALTLACDSIVYGSSYCARLYFLFLFSSPLFSRSLSLSLLKYAKNVCPSTVNYIQTCRSLGIGFCVDKSTDFILLAVHILLASPRHFPRTKYIIQSPVADIAIPTAIELI